MKFFLQNKVGSVSEKDYSSLFDEFSVASAIRIPEVEFDNIDRNQEFVTHFNLQSCGHKANSQYLLVKIIKHGYEKRRGEAEIPPVLSVDGAIKATCVDVKNNIPYNQLKSDDFKYSFKNIKSPSELLNVMKERYMKTRGLSENEIETLGVSSTTLKFQ